GASACGLLSVGVVGDARTLEPVRVSTQSSWRRVVRDITGVSGQCAIVAIAAGPPWQSSRGSSDRIPRSPYPRGPMRRSMSSRARLCIACTLLSASTAAAQGQPPGTVTTSLAVTGVHQFDADLDEGGQAGWSAASISAGVSRQMVPAFAMGISARHISERWRIESPTALAGGAPWRDLQRSNVGLNLSLALSHTFLVGLSPVVELAREQDVSAEDALTYGAVVSAVKVVSPKLTLGAGASINRQFYSVKVSPFLIINWKWSDRFKIANAL